MRAFIIAVTILVPLAVSGNFGSGRARCSSNNACPNGSECVDDFCTVCSVDKAKCIRSVDRCKKLNCTSDQGCYVNEQANSDGSVTLGLQCSAKNPCAGQTCANGETCENVVIGYQPPFAQCRPKYPVSPCDNAYCGIGSRCVTRLALCGKFPCAVEAVCVDLNDCTSCQYFQYCEVTVQDNNVKGSCINFMEPYVPRKYFWG